MTQINKEARQAGELILSQLRQFNQATVLLEQHIQPAFQATLQEIVKRFAADRDWGGEFMWDKKDYHWFARASWLSPEGDKGRFEDHSTAEEGQDYWLALATGQGSEPGEWGYQFMPGRNYFGGAAAFNRYIKRADPSVTASLTASGFRDFGKGNFFLPVKFDALKVAACWQEYGEFPEDDEVFQPLHKALETLAGALPLFDKLLAGAAELTPDEGKLTS